MVCHRCILSVQDILKKIHIDYENVFLGEAEIRSELTEKQKQELINELNKLGFELIDSRKNRLIETVKKSVIEYLKTIEKENEKKQNLSKFISGKINYEYSYISDLFSSVEGTTIENYFISLRVERAKELLVYDEKSISEIAFQLGFSSVHHLSSQFKKETGLSPSYFKRIGSSKRKGIG
jgi:AraC-like DNA-binding protein